MSESHRQDNRPSMQFYPADWLSEPGLRVISLESKGLWIDMLCIMWMAKPRGCLMANGKQIDSKKLAKIVGDSVEKVEGCLRELERYDIFSKLADGTIYNRRMYRQWQIVEKRREAGKKGAEIRWGDRADSKKIAKHGSSTSTSSSNSITYTKTPTKEMLGIFKNVFMKIRDGVPKIDRGKDGKICKTLYQLCQKERPDNPIGLWEERVRVLMEKFNISSIGGISAYWNAAIPQKRRKSWAD